MSRKKKSNFDNPRILPYQGQGQTGKPVKTTCWCRDCGEWFETPTTTTLANRRNIGKEYGTPLGHPNGIRCPACFKTFQDANKKK